MRIPAKALATCVASTAAFALAGCFAASCFEGTARADAHAQSSGPFPARVHSSERGSAGDYQDLKFAQPDEAQISVADFLQTASDSEIGRIESQNGFSFKNSIGPRDEENMGESFSGSFGLESGAGDEKKLRTGGSSARRWFDRLTLGQAFQQVEKVIGIPAVLQRKISYIESKNDPSAVNADTGACGDKQLMPQTEYEMAEKYAGVFGFPELADKIQTYSLGKDDKGRSIVGYRPEARQSAYLRLQCHNVWINSTLAAMNIGEKMRRIDNALNSRGYSSIKYVEADVYIGHFLGARPDIILAYRTHPGAPAKNFVNSLIISQNHGMFYNEQGRARTVSQMYAHIDRDGHGPSRTMGVSPFWRTPVATFQSRVQLAENSLPASSPILR